MSGTIKITPGFLINLMSMARKHEPETLISMLNLEKSSMLTQESLEKFADPEPEPVEKKTDPGSIKARERQEALPETPTQISEPSEQEMPMAFFTSGDEVLGFIKSFVDERPNIYIDPADLMYIVTVYYTGVNDGNKISYNEVISDLLKQSAESQDVMKPSPTEEYNRQYMEDVQRQLGVPVGEREGPVPTEEELASLPRRSE